MVIRRSQNQVGGGPRTLRTNPISKLMNKMRISGYNQEQRLEVLLAGMKGFRKMEKDEADGLTPINRFGRMGSRTRRLRRLVGRRHGSNQ